MTPRDLVDGDNEGLRGREGREAERAEKVGESGTSKVGDDDSTELRGGLVVIELGISKPRATMKGISQVTK